MKLPEKVVVDGNSLTTKDIIAVARHGVPAYLTDDPKIIQLSEESRKFYLASGILSYGDGLGVGANVTKVIRHADRKAFQPVLIDSLDCGIGNPLGAEVVRGAMLLRANSLLKEGCSAIGLDKIARILLFLDRGILPIICEDGSVGASGDLVPLSPIAQAIQGKREVSYRGEVRLTADVLRELGLTGLTLDEKEGLSLVNGTSVSTALAALAVDDARYLANLSLACEALAIETFRGLTDHLDPFVHKVKNHIGQQVAARALRQLLEGSHLTQDIEELRREVKKLAAGAEGVVETSIELQDPYCLRCAAQVFGPTLELLDLVERWVVEESNSGNDNPISDLHGRKVYHTGNFSGFYIALGADILKLAMFNIADLLHALKARLLNEKYNRGLGASLAGERPGFYSGLKGMDIGTTDIFGKVAFLASPMSLHRRGTESYNQDVVSFSFGAAEYAMELNEEFRRLMTETLIILAQAIDKRVVEQGGTVETLLAPRTKMLYEQVRKHVAFIGQDRPTAPDNKVVLDLLRRQEIELGVFISACETDQP